MAILKNIVSISHKDWHTQIPLALLAYRTSIHTPMGTTPFSLVYGAEAVMPLELKIPSLHIQLQDLLPKLEAHHARLDQLLLLDEWHVNTLEHFKVYKIDLK